MSGFGPPDRVGAYTGAAEASAAAEEQAPDPAGGRTADKVSSDADRLAHLLGRGGRDSGTVERQRENDKGGRDGRHRGRGDDESMGGADGQIPPATSVMFQGDAVLAGLGLQPTEGSADAPSNTASLRTDTLAQLVDNVADRVLVGSRADGTAVVHASLKSELLGGQASVEIARTGGAIEVRIETQAADAQQLLRDRGAELAATLSERLGSRVVVQVPAAGGGEAASDSGEEGRQRRSRAFDTILSYAAG